MHLKHPLPLPGPGRMKFVSKSSTRVQKHIYFRNVSSATILQMCCAWIASLPIHCRVQINNSAPRNDAIPVARHKFIRIMRNITFTIGFPRKFSSVISQSGALKVRKKNRTARRVKAKTQTEENNFFLTERHDGISNIIHLRVICFVELKLVARLLVSTWFDYYCSMLGICRRIMYSSLHTVCNAIDFEIQSFFFLFSCTLKPNLIATGTRWLIGGIRGNRKKMRWVEGNSVECVCVCDCLPWRLSMLFCEVLSPTEIIKVFLFFSLLLISFVKIIYPLRT